MILCKSCKLELYYPLELKSYLPFLWLLCPVSSEKLQTHVFEQTYDVKLLHIYLLFRTRSEYLFTFRIALSCFSLLTFT